MEFRLKLNKVMEKSWNRKIRPKCHGKVMKLTNIGLTFYETVLIWGDLS